jgi:hypothetical protein
MKKSIFILGSIIAIAILFYPQQSISLSTGSPGGKTGSPTDGVDCMQCHGVLSTSTTTSNITSNIPPSGYVPGNIYNITAVHNGAGFGDPTGFEITCEENTSNTKTGIFFITNSNTTQLVNNGNAVTHTAAGNSFMTWSFDWEAPLSGTGNVTFYGAFIEAGYPIGLNQGDYFSSTTLSASEFIPLLGCTDTVACNYNASASVDDSSCIYVNISVSTSNVSCNGFTDGGVVATANGGVTPYQYSIDGATWQSSNAFSNLTAGTYFIDVTGINGCTSQEQVVISEPNPLFVNAFSTDISCFGYCDGSAFSMPSGGTPPYSYLWSNGNITDNISGLCAGAYVVNITDANNCVNIETVVISEPFLLSTSINVTDETAALNDGSANAIVLGGVSPYSYSWSNGSATNPNLNLSPGLYTVDVIDANGCIVSTPFSVNAYTPTDIIDIENASKNLRNITDMLGQETPSRNNTPLFYIYDDGTVEKRIIIE